MMITSICVRTDTILYAPCHSLVVGLVIFHRCRQRRSPIVSMFLLLMVGLCPIFCIDFTPHSSYTYLVQSIVKSFI